MFLKEVLAHRSSTRGRHAAGIRQAEEAGAYVPGIWRLFAWKPELADPLSRLTQAVMRGPSPLSPGFRELIAAWTSCRNHCLF